MKLIIQVEATLLEPGFSSIIGYIYEVIVM